MRIGSELTDDAVLAEIGTRIARARLERNLTQEELAERAGIARVTLARLELGEVVKTPALIRVLRALGLLDVLDRLLPEPGPSPIDLLELQGHQRRRASGRRAAKPPSDETRPFRWGDES